MEILTWHFTGDRLRDGSPIPPIGEWLEFTDKVKMCESGLHASKRPSDALRYAPGELLHRVVCNGIVEQQDNKLVCRRRKILQTRNCHDLLRRFAKDQALFVANLWDMPDVMRDYLTGDDDSAAARDAASAAASAAARVAANAAAWVAANAAAWDASSAAARDAQNTLLESMIWAEARRLNIADGKEQGE